MVSASVNIKKNLLEISRPYTDSIEDESSASSAGSYLLFSENNNSSIDKQLYRNIKTRQHVIDFYTDITGSDKYAELILEHAEINNLNYSLVFALVWAESGFNSRAVNFNSNSIDRGLFQLNSSSFPELDEKDFFNPEKNTAYGTRYLKWCIDNGDNVIVALAMYNAGRTKVERNSTPKITLDYISKVLAFQEDIEKKFNDQLVYLLDRGNIALLLK